MAVRNHYRYRLWDGRKIVYIGITHDPSRREIEHKGEGKSFTRIKSVGPAVTQQSAEKWEEERLSQYRRNHRGRNPKYNKVDQKHDSDRKR